MSPDEERWIDIILEEGRKDDHAIRRCREFVQHRSSSDNPPERYRTRPEELDPVRRLSQRTDSRRNN